MSSNTRNPSRGIYTAGLLLALAVAAFFVFRPAEDGPQSGTAEQYVAGLEPVIRDAQLLSGKLAGEPLDQELLDQISELESAWAMVRTGPGYDRKTHDDFIIIFGSYVTRLKSAGLIWGRSNSREDANGARTESENMELLFTLQSMYNIETAAQLMSRRELSVDALLSKTNLSFEITNSLAQSPAVLQDAVRLYEELKSAPAVPQ